MKLRTTLITALFAIFAMGVNAADADKPAETKASPDTAKAGQTMSPKRHSHMEEKTGVPQMAPQIRPDKPAPAKVAKRHLHPRDGK